MDRLRLSRPRLAGMVSGAVLLLAGVAILAQQPARAATGPGPEVCRICHADQYQSYLNSVMSSTLDPRTPGSHGGCVVCHTADGDHGFQLPDQHRELRQYPAQLAHLRRNAT